MFDICLQHSEQKLCNYNPYGKWLIFDFCSLLNNVVNFEHKILVYFVKRPT